MTKKGIILTTIGLGVGALAGYVYYSTVGCSSGGCAITSSPVNSTLYGSFMGALLFSSFNKKKEIQKED
jgi:phage shock protein E